MTPVAAQRGTALIAALLIAALASLAATWLLAGSARQIARFAQGAEQRQMQAFLDAGFEWARSAVAADAVQGGIDHLGEAWAQPFTALPVEGALLSGTLLDAAGRFNLNNLASTQPEVELQRLRRLLAHLGLPAQLADALKDWIDADRDGAYEDAAYLSLASPYRAANQPLASVDELQRVHGFTGAVLERLRPHVSALPLLERRPTVLNANTADLPALMAVLDLPEDKVRTLLAARTRAPFSDVEAIRKALGALAPPYVGVKSDAFTARFTAIHGGAALSGEALLLRDANGVRWVRMEVR
jgi:general secretion pathway protein K